MLTAEQLDALEAFDGGEARVLSVYLDLDPARQVRRSYLTMFADLVKEPREKLTKPARAELSGEASRVQAWLEGQEPHGSGLAVFSCEPRVAPERVERRPHAEGRLSSRPSEVEQLPEQARASRSPSRRASSRRRSQCTRSKPGGHVMGIMDKVGALLPWRGERQAPARPAGLSLRDDLDRWLQGLLEEPRGFRAMSELSWTPSADVQETDDEVIVTVEVPGLDRDDLDLMTTPEGLTVRGEKREEREDKRKDVYIAECSYGSFVRTVPLPPGVDLDRAEARIKRGVLTVRFPKAAGRAGTRRVPIKT